MRERMDFSQCYKHWLFDKMHFQGYTRLFDIMYDTEFVWKLPMDKNRESDGRHLRVLYEDLSHMELTDSDLAYPCSFLEMLVALAESMESIVYEPTAETDSTTWFWMMLDNIGLAGCDDKWFDETVNPTGFVINRIDDVMLRRYSFDGDGGIFPLRNPEHDQRDVQLWYQMNSYILEKELV